MAVFITVSLFILLIIYAVEQNKNKEDDEATKLKVQVKNLEKRIFHLERYVDYSKDLLLRIQEDYLESNCKD